MNDTSPKATVTIKKYANRRLYNTATSAYVTLENLSAMVKEGTEFNVYDAKTGEDITRSVLTQIIVEEEGKSGQQNLLPISFLRQLIGFYGNSMQWMVPKYLEHSMDNLSNNQDQLRSYFQTTFSPIFPFGTTLEEMSKQNLSMFERAMCLFSPFGAQGTQGSAEAPQAEDSVVPEPESQPAPVAPEPVAQEPVVKAVPPVKAAPEPAPVAAVAPVVAPRRVEPAPAPIPTPNVRNATTPSADDMQQKIANLQRQLADLARNRG